MDWVFFEVNRAKVLKLPTPSRRAYGLTQIAESLIDQRFLPRCRPVFTNLIHLDVKSASLQIEPGPISTKPTGRKAGYSVKWLMTSAVA